MHHLVQMMEVAEQQGARFVIDFRDGMFGAVGEDAFARWLDCPHPALQSHPDWDGLCKAYANARIPEDPQFFDAVHFTAMPCRPLSVNEYITPLIGGTPRHRTLAARILRKVNLVFPPSTVVSKTLKEPLFPIARCIDLSRCDVPTLHLYWDVIRRPNWSAERMIWPKPQVIHDIESTWSTMGFSPVNAAAIHVRQTDKSTNEVWRKWIEQIKSGEQFAEQTQIYLATDSRRVLTAFREAGLKQAIFSNPWLELKDDEVALHKRGAPGDEVMRTALYDMWTASRCAAFQPWKFSSFSRVIAVWRQFDRPT